MYFDSPLRSLSLERKHAHSKLGLLMLTPAAPCSGKPLQKNVREDAAQARR
jgi:hypothetical protein